MPADTNARVDDLSVSRCVLQVAHLVATRHVVMSSEQGTLGGRLPEVSAGFGDARA